MNRILHKIILALSFPFCLSSQVLELNLSKANIQKFNSFTYAFGLRQSESKVQLLVYQLKDPLVKTDSLVIDIPKGKIQDFLALSSDTLHDQLNLFLQNKEKKSVQVLKVNRKFVTQGLSDETEITRMNSLSLFQNDLYYYKNEVYTLRSISDTNGKQFYLNKYELKKDKTTFEYEQKWQFPFERKNIQSAKIIFADKKTVLIFVHVGEGSKKGQWILKVNAASGSLKKGTRVGEKGELNSYFFGKTFSDTVNQTIYLIGQKFQEKELNISEKKINLSGKNTITVFISAIDTAGDAINTSEFKIPIVEPKGYVNKTPVNYIARFNFFTQDKEGGFQTETEIYKANNNELCYHFVNSNNFNFVNKEGTLTLLKNTVGTNPMIEKYFLTNDKLDMNGKLCADSLFEFDKLFTRNITLSIHKAFKSDETGNAIWLLKKSEIKKGSENYSVLSPVKKIYQFTSLVNVLKKEEPSFLLYSNKQFLLSRQTTDDKFLLQLFNW